MPSIGVSLQSSSIYREGGFPGRWACRFPGVVMQERCACLDGIRDHRFRGVPGYLVDAGSRPGARAAGVGEPFHDGSRESCHSCGDRCEDQYLGHFRSFFEGRVSLGLPGGASAGSVG